MEKEIPLYIMIYNKIVNRILIGLYPKGYQLDSVQKIHEEHDIGYTSIRRAMRMLQQEGFISAQERKRPIVIFDANDPQGQALRKRIFLSRCQSHIECCRAMPCIIPGLVVAGAQKSDATLISALEELCSQPVEKFTCRHDLLTLIYTWQAMVIQKTDNELASDLFLQIRGFDDLLFLVLPETPLLREEVISTMQWLKYWITLMRRGALQDLYTMVSICCQQTLCGFRRMIVPFCQMAQQQQIQGVDFRWYIRQTPEPLYKKIAFELLRIAQREKIQPGENFPSEQILAEQYGVSVVTVHTAFTMLNSLGVTQTVNGAGTFFTGETSMAPEALPYIREYYESLNILVYCSRAIAFDAAAKLTPVKIEQVCQELQQSTNGIDMLLCVLRCFVKATGIAPLQNIFEQLEMRAIFGMYVSEIGAKMQEQAVLQGYQKQLLDAFMQLKVGSEDTFAVQIGSVFLEVCAQPLKELEKYLHNNI